MTNSAVSLTSLLSDRFSDFLFKMKRVAAFLCDHNNNIAFWNVGGASVFGYAEADIIGRNVSILFVDQQALAGLNGTPGAAPNTTCSFEVWCRRQSGALFKAHVETLTIEDAITGECCRLYAVSDLTQLVGAAERFRQIVESAPNAMVMINRQGLIEMVNTQAERLFGYSREEMLGQPVEILVPDRFRHEHPGKRGQFLGHPISRPMGAGRDLYARRKDGSEFPVEIGLNPIQSEGETLVLSAIVDISERKRLEERFRRVVESAPNAMVMINRQGLIEMVNTQAERMFGYERTEMLGQSVELLVPQRFRHDHPGKRMSFFDDPKSRPMGAGRDLYGRRKDGSEFPIEIGLNPIQSEGETLVLSAIVDISERKRLEERFRRVVESAPSAMVMINGRGQIEMVNTQAERLFGYERAEMLGQPVELLVPERFRHDHPGKRASFFDDPKSRPMGAGRDLYGRRKDGSEFPIEIGLNPIDSDGEKMVLSAIVDISDRKHEEQRIRAALQEKDLLLGEIHHRVKNNLQIVRSMIDLQLYKITDAEVQDMLVETKSRIHSMSLIHQILYESKNFAEVDLGVFLRALSTTLIATYGLDSGRVGLRIDASSVLLPINTAVPCGLLVNELVTNALKHGFPGDRRGEVEISLAWADDEHVRVQVSDNGVGMAADFDIETATTMGLSLINLLSQQLMGSLQVHHRNPTRFSLEFPVTRNAERGMS